MASKQIKGITIEIGANTTKLDKAIGEIEKDSRKINTELREVDRTMKTSGESATLWKQKQTLLTQALESSKEKLELLEKSQEQVNKQFQDGTIGEEQYRAFQRETEKARGEVERYQKGIEEANTKIRVLGDTVEDTGKDVEKMGDKAEKSSDGFTVMKGAISNVISDGFEKLAAAAKEAWAEIDEGYDTIVTKTGATGASLQEMQDIADEVFTSLPVEMSDVGIAVGEVNTRFGVTGDTLKDLSKIFLQYANINGTDVNTSIDEVSAAMRSFNVDASETGDVLGVLTDVSQKTGINTSQLESLLSGNAATFKEMNLSIGEAAQLLGQFEINGVETSTALTALKKAQQNASASGQTMSETLAANIESIKNASDETTALQTATELFGKKGAAEMTQAIREGRFSINDFSKDMTGMRQTVEKTFDATQDAPDEMKKSLNVLKLELSNIANKVLPIVGDWVSKFNDKLPLLKEKVEKFEPLFEGVGKALGVVVDLAGGAFNWLGNVLDATVGYQDRINDVYNDGIKKAEEYSKKIDEQTSVTNDLVESTKEQIYQDESRITHTQQLWDELQKLVDQNGNVKEGYEEQAAYIANELSEATDTEIKLVDGKIDKYEELKGKIQETINMQRAQTMLNANQGLYENALKGQSEYAQNAMENQKGIEKAQKKLDKWEAEARNAAATGNNAFGKVVDLSQAGKFGYGNKNGVWAGLLNEQQWNQVAAAEDSISYYRSAQAQLDKNLDYYLEVIDTYEQANSEMLAGNYATAEATASKITGISRETYRDIESYSEDTASTFRQQVKDAMDFYENEVKAKASGAEKNVKDSIDSAVKYGLENGMSGADLLKTGIIDTLSSIDSFNTDNLKAFMAQTGLDLGDILGQNAYETLSGSMLSAVTQLLYETNNLVVNAVRSPGDVKMLKEGYNIGIAHKASGGYVGNGESAIVAESGPELLSMVNGSVKVTPLNRQAQNTAVKGSSGKVMYQNITVNANVNSKYDVSKLAEDLATQSRRIEIGRGL